VRPSMHAMGNEAHHTGCMHVACQPGFQIPACMLCMFNCVSACVQWIESTPWVHSPCSCTCMVNCVRDPLAKRLGMWALCVFKPRAKHRGGPRHTSPNHSSPHTPERPAPWRPENSSETNEKVVNALQKRSGTWAPRDSGWIFHG